MLFSYESTLEKNSDRLPKAVEYQVQQPPAETDS